MAKTHENEIDIKVMMGQFRLLKWLSGVSGTLLCAGLLSVSGWAYGIGKDVSDIQKHNEFQDKTITQQEMTIKENSKETRQLSGDVRDTKTHVEYIRESVKELVDLVKNLRQ